MPNALLADMVLLLHLAVVVFVIAAPVAILIGHPRHWPMVDAPWFRIVHLLAIGIVVLQAWLGEVCPLTTLESWLRIQAGGAAYETGFIEHWLHRLLFYRAPPWVFTVSYTAFAVFVLWVTWRCPPRRGRSG